MNRNEEYAALLTELDRTPEALKYTVERALNRKNTSRKKWRFFGIPAGSLAACFLGFMLLVNLFPPFARACGSVPILRELAKAVAWSPSLSAAVENDYVQPIGQSQTVNGITATIQYVIVDQKQLNIFFTLNSKDYDNLSTEMPAFSPDQHCSIRGAGFRQPPGTLLNFTLDYVDGDVPDGFTMTFGATTYVEQEPGQAPTASIYDEYVPEEPEILAEFTFTLEFDPQYTARGEMIPVEKTVSMDGQTMTITEAEVYPTHVRINVAGDPGNTAWLTGLDFYLENERGERFDPISNGISATGSERENGEVSYRLESSYFSRCQHLTLHITGATWLSKDREKIPIDLKHGTAEWMPEGVELYSVERRGDDWAVQFRTAYLPGRENYHYQVFLGSYYDSLGSEYYTDGFSSTSTPICEGNISDEQYQAMEEDAQGHFFELLILRDYPEDTVWMTPCFSHRTQEATPITIPIK